MKVRIEVYEIYQNVANVYFHIHPEESWQGLGDLVVRQAPWTGSWGSWNYITLPFTSELYPVDGLS